MQLKKFIFILIIIIALFLFFGCMVNEEDVNPKDVEKQLQENKAIENDIAGFENNPYSGTCTKGKVDEFCTGECGSFIDTDKDGYCDRAQ